MANNTKAHWEASKGVNNLIYTKISVFTFFAAYFLPVLRYYCFHSIIFHVFGFLFFHSHIYFSLFVWYFVTICDLHIISIVSCWTMLQCFTQIFFLFSYALSSWYSLVYLISIFLLVFSSLFFWTALLKGVVGSIPLSV